MELKWDIPGQSAGFYPAGSNRTFMELKSQYFLSMLDSLMCSNRTFMELKFVTLSVVSDKPCVLIVPLWN